MNEGAIRRTGPPQAIQKLRADSYLVQLPLSAVPTADWRRLFYEAQHNVPPDFPPRAIEISGPFLRFRSDVPSVGGKVPMIDGWIERANEKEAALATRSEEHRRRRQEVLSEQQELAELNATWTDL